MSRLQARTEKVGTTLGMLQWKAGNGVTDKGFEELLGIIKNMLPEGNELSSTTHKAKKGCLPSWIGGSENSRVLTTVFSIAMNMRNWMLVQSVTRNGTRSGKMILVMSTESPLRKRFPQRLCGISQ